MSRAADGTGGVQPPTQGLVAPAATSRFNGPPSATWSAYGAWLVFRHGELSGGQAGPVYVRAGLDTLPTVYLDEAHSEFGPSLSPDARWLACMSDESDRSDVYVRPFPDAEDATWVGSRNGATNAPWSHRGGEIFFLDRAGWMNSASVRTEPTFAVDRIDALFDASAYAGSGSHRRFDVT